jgi:hypothetical protein
LISWGSSSSFYLFGACTSKRNFHSLILSYENRLYHIPYKGILAFRFKGFSPTAITSALLLLTYFNVQGIVVELLFFIKKSFYFIF